MSNLGIVNVISVSRRAGAVAARLVVRVSDSRGAAQKEGGGGSHVVKVSFEPSF